MSDNEEGRSGDPAPEEGKSAISTLEEGGMRFWNLNFDPFSELPLFFENYRDYDFLVKTSNINLMSNIFAQLSTDSVSKIILLLGDRGSGKTSALRYLHSLLDERTGEKNDVSIYCNIESLDDEGHMQIRDTLHRAILCSILEKMEGTERLGKQLDIRLIEEIAYSGEIPRINREIRRILNMISRYYNRTFVFVDNLDKSEPQKYREFETYFRKNQGFYEEITKSSTFLFIAMQSSIGSFLESSHETGFLGRKAYRMKKWSSDELNQLISKRLQSAYSGQDFHLNSFFETEALKLIYERNRYLPRYIINSCRRLLERAYIVSQQERSEIPYKPIRKIFLRKHKDCIRGYAQREYIDFGIIDSLALECHQKAYELIENCFKSNKAIIYELIEAMFSLKEQGTFHDKMIVHTLENMKVIQSITSRKKKKYQLVPIVDNLINYLINSMEDDEDSVKYYLMSHFT